MKKNIIIVIMALVIAVGGLLLIINSGKVALAPVKQMPPAVTANNPEATTTPRGEATVPKAPELDVVAQQEAEKKRKEDELKRTWLESYQIGASHPNSYDPGTLEPVDEFYAKDKNNVYFVEISSVGTATTFKTVYNIGVVVGADPKTFSSSVYPYSKDSLSVYHYGKKLSGIDAATFENLMMGYVKDKNGAYFENKKISAADVATFTHFDGYYAKDAKAVYYKNKKISGADVASFVTVNAREAYDVKFNYYDGKVKDKR